MSGPPMGVPPGMDPRVLEQIQQMQQAQQKTQQQAAAHKEETRAQARLKANPMPGGRPGLKTLRALSECPIPDEASAIQKLLDKILDLELEDMEEPLQIVGEGIAAVIMADTYCQKYKTQRPTVRFNDDEELQKHHSEVHELTAQVRELQTQIAEASQALQNAYKARWETAVKKFGLAPEKFMYELNEDEGIIYLVDLKCQECSGRTRTRRARQAVAEKLVTFERESKEKDDDSAGKGSSTDAPEGHANPDGEARIQEQEVPGVANTATPDGGDGDNRAD